MLFDVLVDKIAYYSKQIDCAIVLGLENWEVCKKFISRPEDQQRIREGYLESDLKILELFVF
jgi:hypothetical protein